MYRETFLNNGIGIVSFRMPEMDSVCLGIWVAVGSRFEDEKNNGISHFVEHLLFKGSRKRSSRKIREDIEGSGGSLNGFTSEECTCYLARVPGNKLKLTLDVLSDMVFHPLLRIEDIEKERGVIKEEISRQKDQPMQYVHVLFDRLMWGKHPLGFNVVGTTETINSIAKKDISDYRNSYYTPGNILMAVAGKVEHDAVTAEIARCFSRLAPSKRSKAPGLREKQVKPQIVFEKRKTEQTHVCIGTRALPYKHPDRYVLGVLNVILGGNMSSRLFEQVREKRGLAYHISSFVQRYADAGSVVISAGVDSRRVRDAIEVTIAEMMKIAQKDVLKKEIAQAKEFLRGQTLLSMEDTCHRMAWLGESKLFLEKVPTVDEIIQGVQKVTISDIRRVSLNLFKEDRLNLAVIGPNEKTELEKLFRDTVSNSKWKLK